MMKALYAETEKEQQQIDAIVKESLRLFEQFWGFKSKSFIAPCYCWSESSEKALADSGVELIQSWRSKKAAYQSPVSYYYTGQRNKYNQSYSVRNCSFDPSSIRDDVKLDALMKQVDNCFSNHKIAIFENHRINYASGIDKQNRDNTLLVLDKFIGTLIKRFPDVEFMKYFATENELQFDYHIPFLSVPYVLGLNENNNMFVGKSGYLKADPELVKKYYIEYFNNTKFKIGIKWRGNTHYEMDRVIDIKSFTKLFNLPNTQFYSFQTFEGAEDLNEVINDYNIIDIGKTVTNFADTAGALENLDLVICNDTSLAHLAGAMSKPCWILLPYLYNWRWHLDLTKCDWYDTIKLYRQKEWGNWDEIFDRMYEDLLKIV